MRAGDPPRTRLVIRLIAIERSLRGVLLLAAGTYLLFHLNTDFGHLAEWIIRSIDVDPRQRFFHRIVTRLHHLHAHELRIAGLAALGYGDPAGAMRRSASKRRRNRCLPVPVPRGPEHRAHPRSARHSLRR